MEPIIRLHIQHKHHDYWDNLKFHLYALFHLRPCDHFAFSWLHFCQLPLAFYLHPLPFLWQKKKNDFLVKLPSECLMYCRTILMRYKSRARKQAEPHSKKSPQKLLSGRRSTSCFAPSELHALLVSHLSWILCRPPFSDSFRIAVDMSIASGESRGKA